MHKQKCTLVNPETDAGRLHFVSEAWISGCSLLVLLSEMSASECFPASSGIADLWVTVSDCLQAHRGRINSGFPHIREESRRDAVLRAALTE